VNTGTLGSSRLAAIFVKMYAFVGIAAVFVRPDLTKKIGAKAIADENLSAARN